MSIEQSKGATRRFIEEVMGQGPLDLLPDLLSPDVRDEHQLPGQPCGLQGQRHRVETMRRSHPDLTTHIEHLISEGDLVMADWTASGANTEPIRGRSRTRRRITFSGANLFRFREGKITQIWHVEDRLGQMQQLGLAPAREQPAAYGRPNLVTVGGSHPGGLALRADDVRALIRRRYKKLFDEGDIAAVAGLLHARYLGHISGFPPIHGQDGYREFLSVLTGGLADRRTEIEDVLVEGDMAGCRVTYRARSTAGVRSTFGLSTGEETAAGREIEVDGLVIFRLLGDKILEQWAHNDDLGIMQQLGVIPAPEGRPAAEPC